MCDVAVTVIGGGVVGCAVAAQVAGQGLSTVLLEKMPDLARGITSRNSEVAHGGMYYPTGSLKARFCVSGRRQLKAFCARTGVDYNECGKLIVAVTEAQVGQLQTLLELGQANDVEDLALVTGAELKNLVPEVTAVAGLFSPRTGVLDAEGVTRALAADAMEQGAQILTDAPVIGLTRQADQWHVQVGTPDSRRPGWSHTSRIVINAAGLYADHVAQLAGIDVPARDWTQQWLKGNYFSVAPARTGRLDKLVYPVPPADGSSLGVHVCLDLAGQMRLGPDTEGLLVQGDEDYRVDPQRADVFFQGASRFLPWLKPQDLQPAFAGIRPKLTVTGFRDFVVETEQDDLAGLINLIGIDSPGLTSSLALADEVGRQVRQILN